MRPDQTKILIIQTAFIGDVVLCTPLISALADRFPTSEIHALVRKGNEGLLIGNPHLKKVHIWDKSLKRSSEFRRLQKVIKAEQYNMLYNLQRFAFTGALTAFSGINFRAGFKANPFSLTFERRVEHSLPQKDINGRILHEVQRNILLMGLPAEKYLWKQTDGGKLRPPRPELYPSDNDRQHIEQYLTGQPFVVIAPASVWYTKQWPASKWSALMGLMPSELHIMLVGGPGDAELADRLIKSHPERSSNLCGKLSFLQTAALMQQSVRVFTNDSAPLHFASAANAPTTAVFCSTLPEYGFGPLSDDSTVIRASSCCSTGKHGHRSCPEQHFNCAMNISTDAVLQTLGNWKRDEEL